MDEQIVPLRKQYLAGAFRNAPEWLRPALVLIMRPVDAAEPLASVFLTDVPDQQTGSGLLVVPVREIDTYFEISEGLCPSEFANEFHTIQAWLIQKAMPMMGPLFYLRVATLMKYNGLSVDEAALRCETLEAAMLEWVRLPMSRVQAG